MSVANDRLYDLLPVIYRIRDHEQGQPLRAILDVISEQVGIVEDDIAQLYENWFIDTAEDWAVPYIADLVGYRPIREAGQPYGATSARGIQRNKILIPRRDVANSIRNRRRKGTLALLEQLAQDVAGWPARAVEVYRLLAVAPRVQGLPDEILSPPLGAPPFRGATVNLRNADALERTGGPFDELSHTVDVRRPDSQRTPGLHNVPSLGLFVWRLRPFSITRAPAYYDDRQRNHYWFSVLGNDSPLFTLPVCADAPTSIAGEWNVPAPIRRRAFQENLAAYYGEQKSLYIWRDGVDNPVPIEQIVVADLTDWTYQPAGDRVAVDPVLGRFAFAPRAAPDDVRVSYHYGFAADLGGGEYRRSLERRPGQTIFSIDPNAARPLDDALSAWAAADPDDAAIEIPDSGEYTVQDRIDVRAGQRLELRAASGARPLIRIQDQRSNRPDALRIGSAAPAGQGQPVPAAARGRGRQQAQQVPPAQQPPAQQPPAVQPGGTVVLNGLLISGRGIQVRGQIDVLEIRHCTLVPGWTLAEHCEPEHGQEASLLLEYSRARLVVERSILGSIQVIEDAVQTDPLRIEIEDSILDATDPDESALSTGDGRTAHVRLAITRSTVVGRILTHAIDLAENSILGLTRVARRGVGCVRFCYLPPGSRTPRRYGCQPDLVEEVLHDQLARGEIGAAQLAPAIAREQARVRPRFSSLRYGTPAYGQLALRCPEEIRRGADDESEMGVFHDLYQPQRHANLDARLDEFTPAGTDVGIVYVT